MNFIKAFVETLDEETFNELYLEVSKRRERENNESARTLYATLSYDDRNYLRRMSLLDATKHLHRDAAFPLTMARKVARLAHGEEL